MRNRFKMIVLAAAAAACLLTVPAAAREFALDGGLAEWTQADRLDSEPALAVPGQELYGYHNAAAGKYHFALRSTGSIGPTTTFWLNTDRSIDTGYLVWGSAVGAEFNVNIAGDGAPHLYTGADGEQWVLGPLSHAYSADGTILEFELTEAMLGTSEPIGLFVDINNAVFMPSWYGTAGYVVDAVGVPAPPSSPAGAITLDGSLQDWAGKDRIDRLPGAGVLGYELYGRADATHYYLALRALPPADGPGPGTTFWLNTDRDRTTGYQVWGIAVGAEHNVNIAADGTPHLYTGAAAQNWQIGPLPYARSADGLTLEIAIDRTLLAASARAIDVSVDVIDSRFLPADFTGPGYTLFHPDDLPARVSPRPLRVGIVYSATTKAHYFGDKAYPQLFAAMQHQAMLAGIPYTLLREDDLKDIANIKDLDALIIPYFSHVVAADLQAIEDTLIKAIHHYGIGVITAGNFLTNDAAGPALPGDSYARMKRLFGVTLSGYFGPANHVVNAGADHPVVRGYVPREPLVSYAGGYMQYYKRHFSVAQPIATVTDTAGTYDAAWAIDTGARSVHFASPSVLGDTDLVWRALLWAVYGDRPFVGLGMTRNSSVFISRCDMDQSQYADEAPIVYDALLPIVQNWKALFGFVGSYYVNVGNKPKEQEYTDWSYSGPVYKQLMALGGEIGTHSYTHPDFTGALSNKQLEFEFKQSRDEIAAHIGVPVTGAAVPGAPETLAVDVELNKYFAHVTADYSGIGAGYHGAMGALTPDFQMTYLAPNMYFDFTMIDFLQWDAARALAAWKQQYDSLVAHAPGAFVVWPWHDYGPTGYEGPRYTSSLFTGLLEHAFADGAEFVTADQASKRIGSFVGTGLSVEQVDADTIAVSVKGDAVTGALALRLEAGDGRTIESVDGWPAFDGDRVLLGPGARKYVVHLGKAAAGFARIRKLPMRAFLHDVQAGPTSLTFTFTGEGVVEAVLPAGAVGGNSNCGAAATTLPGGVMRLDFAQAGTHTCVLSYGP